MSNCSILVLVVNWNGNNGHVTVQEIQGSLPKGVRLHQGGRINNSGVINSLRGQKVRPGDKLWFFVKPGGKYKLKCRA